MALAGIDMAAWDTLAQACQLPLVQLLGGQAHPIPAYLSLRTIEMASVDIEIQAALSAGFQAVKVRLGHWELKRELEMSALSDKISEMRRC